MITVKKENRLLTVDERSLDYYLREGYDHVELNPEKNDYTIIKPAKGKLVPFEDLLKAQAEIEALKAEIEQLKAEASKASKQK